MTFEIETEKKGLKMKRNLAFFNSTSRCLSRQFFSFITFSLRCDEVKRMLKRSRDLVRMLIKCVGVSYWSESVSKSDEFTCTHNFVVVLGNSPYNQYV